MTKFRTDSARCIRCGICIQTCPKCQEAFKNSTDKASVVSTGGILK